MKRTRKDDLVETAWDLFNRYGFHATGIDRVLAESGVSKATLYKYFKSKDELILEVLTRRHCGFLADMQNKVNDYREAHPQALPGEAAMLLFEALDEWFQADNFCGCNFINASAEFSDESNPIHIYASEHKQAMLAFVDEDLHPLSAETRQRLSEQILVLIDGAIIQAQVRGDLGAARVAANAAQQLLAAAR